MIIRLLTLLLLALALWAQNPNTAKFPSALPTDTDLLVAKNRLDAALTLSSNIDASTLTVPVNDGSLVPIPGVIRIDYELIKICSRVGNTLTVCSAGRGFDSSVAQSHSSGATISNVISAWYHNQVAAEIISIATRLGTGFNGQAISTTQITSGQLALARGGTGADLSATGGSGYVLKQSSVGAGVTVAALVSSDLPTTITGLVSVTSTSFVGALTGNASTATALAANPADCSANQYATTIAANGDLTCAQPAASNLSNGTTGTGSIVLASSPTIVTPTIASFVNATHSHQNAAGGGTLAGASALSDYSTAFVTSITGTANQVIRSASVGGVTLSLPQDIHTAATPTFAGLTLIGNAILSSAGTTSLFLKADNAYAWNIQATTGSADLKIIRGTDTYGSIGWGNGTLTWYNQTATTGSTSLVVRAGAGQSSNILFQLQDNSANVFMKAYASNGSVYFQAPGVASSEAYMLPGSGVFEFGGNTGVALKLTANAQERLRLNATGIGFFGATPVAKQTAPTAANASALNTGDATSDAVIGNMRTRLGEVITALQNLGLLN